MKKVLVIFGGNSAEHEVSFMSAKNVVAALDRKKYSPLLVGISKEGSWYHFSSEDIFKNQKSLDDQHLPSGLEPVSLICEAGKPKIAFLNLNKKESVDVAFPVLHGTNGEDGTIQGLFQMMNLAYVGCGVLASALGMDKEVMKRVLKQAGIPVAPWVLLTPENKMSFEEVSKTLGAPFFIKPSNAGSSVGVFKIKTKADYEKNLPQSFQFDNKVLAESFMAGQEIECSVLGTQYLPEASVPGEVVPTHEFYSYEAKYLDENGAAIKIPAKLASEHVAQIQSMAKKTFTALCCQGMARVDFFLKTNGELVVNEINTIPGFTKISMYPKMWEASGINYENLISKLIQLALDRETAERKIVRRFQT